MFVYNPGQVRAQNDKQRKGLKYQHNNMRAKHRVQQSAK